MRDLAEVGGEELRNASFVIAGTDQRRIFDYGLFHWNALVQDYVPAQIVGTEFKSGLMVDLDTPDWAVYYHVPSIGSTSTGLADAFQSFWYFGFVKFAAIGWLMGLLYRAGNRGHLLAQVAYALLASYSLVSITHHTNWFLSRIVHMSLFLLPVLVYARRMPVRRADLPAAGNVQSWAKASSFRPPSR
jgi:hypothetical protein